MQFRTMDGVGGGGWWGRNWKWVTGLLLVAVISAARSESSDGGTLVAILNLGAWGLLIVGIVEWWRRRHSATPATNLPPPPPQPTAAQATPMWAVDPFGRHELRYWDGARWSGHVSNAGLQSYDPTPP